MIDWLAMGGHGFYIWSAYGVLLLALVIEVIVLRGQRRGSLREARARREGGEAPMVRHDHESLPS